jgi:FtsZ-binding cell division protein ZapB
MEEEIKEVQKIMLEHITLMPSREYPFRTGISSRKVYLIAKEIVEAQQKEIEQLKEDKEAYKKELQDTLTEWDLFRVENTKLKEELSNYTRTDIKP